LNSTASSTRSILGSLPRWCATFRHR
jgi:hypothetical protein